MTSTDTPLTFTGSGRFAGHSWWRGEGDEVPDISPEEARRQGRPLPPGHPQAYEAAQELVDAVNVALQLRRPLLVTGNPGTGKTELAERIAYEFELGPVLRFEAQSLSEANDLFYRFDYISQLVVAKLAESRGASPEEANILRFVQWGPLGQAILRSAPEALAKLEAEAHRRAPPAQPLPGATEPPLPAAPKPRRPARSVVLIDEIDKASRDFPNDLLNGIDRMEFRLKELGGLVSRGADRDSPFHPIVIVTSNSERDLPAPFMRRCLFVHIPDPELAQLAAIVRKRVFDDGTTPPPGQDGLPPLYSRLLTEFVGLRKSGEMRQQVGTSELIDFMNATRASGVDGNGTSPHAVAQLTGALSAIAKHRDDRKLVKDRLDKWFPLTKTA